MRQYSQHAGTGRKIELWQPAGAILSPFWQQLYLLLALFALLVPGYGQYHLRMYHFSGAAGTASGSNGSVVVGAMGQIAGEVVGGDEGVVAGVVPAHRHLKVIAPAAAAQWQVATTHTIEWGSIGAVQWVRIEYSTTAGSSWEVITSAAVNDGCYQWQPLEASATAMIRVMDAKDRIIVGSSEVFQIVPLQPPQNVEAIAGDGQVALRWDASPSEGIEQYRIYRGTTTAVMTLLGSTSGSATSYVDESVSNGTTYYYALSSRIGAIESEWSAIVSATPMPTTLTLSYPTTGAVVSAGMVTAITWSWTGAISQVRILYRRTPVHSWSTVATVANSGSYSWQVPDEPTTSAEIRLEAVGMSGVESQGNFEIRSTTQTALPIALWLEGAYDATVGTMRVQLENSGFLPSEQPYGEMGYSGSEQRQWWVSGIVDWVLIEVRNTTTNVVGRTVGLLLWDGRVVDESGYPQVLVSSSVVPAGSYYVVIRHRNHLAMMSSTMGTVGVGWSAGGWDFRQGMGEAYQLFAEGQKQVGNEAVMIGGDITQNGIINAADRVKVRADLFQTGYEASDVSLDGVVNAEDRSVIVQNTFRVTQVP